MHHDQPPALTISKLHIRYQHHWLFDKFDFYLPANQWTCLLGPSGVGKSSLLRYIVNLQNEQDTECSGRVIASDGLALDGRVSYITQEDSLLPWLNIFDNVVIGFCLRCEKVTLALKKRASFLLEKVGLAHAEKLKPGQISAGMRQRVVLVRTVLEDRQVILLDEPFSSLDTVNRLQLQELAATMFTNKTILLVTHDPLEALRLCHNLYLLVGSPAKMERIHTEHHNILRGINDAKLFIEQEKLIQKMML